MTDSKMRGIQEITTVLMNDVLVFLCVIWVAGMPEAWRYLVYGVVPFVFYFLRKKVKVQGFSIILQVVFLAALLYISSLFEHSMVYYVVSVVLFGYSIYIRTKRERMEDMPVPPAAVLTMIVIINISAMFSKDLQPGKTLVIGTIIYACSYMICYYLESYEKFVVANRSSTGYMPEKLILKSGFSLVGIYAVISGVILAVCAYITDIQKFTRYIVRWLVLLFAGMLNNMERSEIQHEYEYKEVIIDYGMDGPMEGETGVVAQILEYALIVLSLVIIGAIVYGIVRFIQKKFGQTVEEELQTNSPHVADKVEVVERIKGKKMWEGFHINLTPQEKIRKAFRNYMNQKYKEHSEKADGRTARQWLGLSDDMTMESREEYARIYEKARYSEEECTSFDVKHMLTIKKRK